MGYARKDVEKTKKIAKKFVRYQEGAELYSIGLTKVDFSNVKIKPIFKKLLKFMLDDGERKDRTAMESNDTAAGMPYMAYIRHKKEYVNIPPQGLLMSELSDIIKASYQ